MFNIINIIKSKYQLPIRFIKGWFKAFGIEPFPSLSIEVTSACNSRCGFCPNATMKRARQHLDMRLFEKTVNEYAAMGGGQISPLTAA